jgi:ATP-dependent DNA helicase PIF1
MEPEEATQYPTEFFNSLEPTGLPPHTMTLKTGCPMMLLRNIDPPKLCNRTRLIIKQMNNNVIDATIITGQSKGQQVFLPKNPFIPSDCPIIFKRLQFSFRPCFAMTINKAQGQSLNVVGLNLESPCFSHGQLAVPGSVQHIISSFTVQRPEPGILYTQLHFDKSTLLTTCKFLPAAC